MFFLRCFCFSRKTFIFENFCFGGVQKNQDMLWSDNLGSWISRAYWTLVKRESPRNPNEYLAVCSLPSALCVVLDVIPPGAKNWNSLWYIHLYVPFKKSSIQTKNVGKYTIDGDPMGYDMARFSVLFLLWLFYRAIQQFGIEAPKSRTRMYTFEILKGPPWYINDFLMK